MTEFVDISLSEDWQLYSVIAAVFAICFKTFAFVAVFCKEPGMFVRSFVVMSVFWGLFVMFSYHADELDEAVSGNRMINLREMVADVTTEARAVFLTRFSLYSEDGVITNAEYDVLRDFLWQVKKLEGREQLVLDGVKAFEEIKAMDGD